jgi:hypothetical protein
MLLKNLPFGIADLSSAKTVILTFFSNPCQALGLFCCCDLCRSTGFGWLPRSSAEPVTLHRISVLCKPFGEILFAKPGGVGGEVT